jgi:hypothetical protein
VHGRGSDIKKYASNPEIIRCRISNPSLKDNFCLVAKLK